MTGPAMDTWSELMAAAQCGDRAAYRRLLSEVLPWLRAMALRRLRDAAEAEDAVQDTLLTLHAMRRAYDPRRPFRPWLAAIARHRITDRFRRRVRRATRETALDPDDETFAAPPTNVPGESIDVAAMRRALASLPPGQRRAIELLKLKEMSLQEAAAATGMTVGALKVATHRALARLRVAMADVVR